MVPYDMVLDREMWRWTPAEVSLLFTRTPHLDLDVTLEMVESVGDLGTVRRSGRLQLLLAVESLRRGDSKVQHS